MKTLKWKPALEVLEDRLVPTSLGSVIVPTESMSLGLRAEGTAMTQLITNTAMSQRSHDSAWVDYLIVVDGFRMPVAGASRFVEGVDFNPDPQPFSEGVENALVPAKTEGIFIGGPHGLGLMGDGSPRHAALLAGSTEYLRTCEAPTGPVLSTEANRFQEQPLSVLIGVLWP